MNENNCTIQISASESGWTAGLIPHWVVCKVAMPTSSAQSQTEKQKAVLSLRLQAGYYFCTLCSDLLHAEALLSAQK